MRDKSDTIDTLIETLDVHHHEAYTAAAEKHLKEGQVYKHDKLKEGKVQQGFAQSMVDFYVTKARERLGIAKDKKLNDEEVDMLLMAYANITKGELLDLIREAKNKFTLSAFSTAVRDPDRGFLSQVRRRLEPSASAHIQDTLEDKMRLVEDIGLKGKVDPRYMTRTQVLRHASTYHRNQGVISPADYQDQVYVVKSKSGH